MIDSEEQFLPEIYQWEELMTRLSWLSKRHAAHQLSKYQLTLPQFKTLRCLEQNEAGIPMSALANDCQAVMPTMTGIINRLVKRGIVERCQDPQDRRTTLIHLTPDGKALLDEINHFRRSEINQLLVEQSAAERKVIFNIMARYLDKLEEWTRLEEEQNEE